MNLATLRVEGSNAEIEALKTSLPLDIETSWKEGEAMRRGVHRASGFNTTVADTENPKQLVEAVREFLAECKNRSIEFSNPNLTAELSIGIAVGDSVQFVASVDFTTYDLEALAALGIALSITAYPTSDEANENENDA